MNRVHFENDRKPAEYRPRIEPVGTRLDEEIEQLEFIVEKRLNLCEVTWDGTRCTLPSTHDVAEPHNFPISFLETLLICLM